MFKRFLSSAAKPALVVLAVVLVNAVYLFTGVWGRLLDIIDFYIDDGSFWGGVFSWLAFLAIVAATVFLGFLLVSVFVGRNPCRVKWFWLPLVLLVLPIAFFDIGPETKTCFRDEDCVGAHYSCCPTCVNPSGAVNRRYQFFRRGLSRCFLEKFCPLVKCVPREYLTPTCEGGWCILRVERSGPSVPRY